MIKCIYIYADGGKRYRVIDFHVVDPSDTPAAQAMHKQYKPNIHVAFNVGEDERMFDHEATPEELAEAFK